MANESSVVGGSSMVNGFNANETLSCRGYPKQRICLVGSLKDNESVVQAAKCQGLPVVYSESGEEFAGDRGTVFVVENFEGPLFEQLKQRSLVLGPLVLLQCAERSIPFPDKGRPIYNLAMDGLVIVFTGFKSRSELCELLLLSHYMGASVRDKFSSRTVTHCVADCVTSAKYELSDALDIPIMKKEWLLEAWAHRNEKDFSVTSESMRGKTETTKGRCSLVSPSSVRFTDA
ncbi:hypothetical protein HPB51_014584 [Rhipicephalus microplus]|uniref:BRCT domain-containing protein n=1 Tax=Rhipicephalus microplus TaxID=6941 RepID=A0A9J6F476_RHIMP|nr:hypothetical protein HPB51_014584 [Rhipicephalus microplus]